MSYLSGLWLCWHTEEELNIVMYYSCNVNHVTCFRTTSISNTYNTQLHLSQSAVPLSLFLLAWQSPRLMEGGMHVIFSCWLVCSSRLLGVGCGSISPTFHTPILGIGAQLAWLCSKHHLIHRRRVGGESDDIVEGVGADNSGLSRFRMWSMPNNLYSILGWGSGHR